MHSKQTANSFLRIFLHIIFKRKLFIITFFAITMLIAGIFAAQSEPTYQASSEILVKLGREHFFVPTSVDDAFRPTISFSSIEQIKSEIELIKSRPLIDQVVWAIGPTVIYDELADENQGVIKRFRLWLSQFIDQLGIKQVLNGDDQEPQDSVSDDLTKAEIALLKVQKNLEVIDIKSSRVIDITFEHKDPVVAAKVIETLVAAYLESRPKIYKSPQSSAFFQEQSQILKVKINETEAELREFKTQHNIDDLEEERTLLLGKRSELKRDLNDSLSKSAEVEKRISKILEQKKKTPARIQKGETTNMKSMLISTLEERLVALEIEERELLGKYTESNHLVQDVRKQLKMIRNKLAEQETKSYGSAEVGPNPTYQRLEEDFFENEAEMAALNSKIGAQKDYLVDYDKRLDDINQFEHELQDLEHKLEVNRANYELYLVKHEESRISSEMDSKNIANVSVIKPAQPPLEPSGNNALLGLVIGFVFAVFGSVGLSIFLEYLNEDLERPEDIEELLGAPVLASVPKERA